MIVYFIPLEHLHHTFFDFADSEKETKRPSTTGSSHPAAAVTSYFSSIQFLFLSEPSLFPQKATQSRAQSLPSSRGNAPLAAQVYSRSLTERWASGGGS